MPYVLLLLVGFIPTALLGRHILGGSVDYYYTPEGQLQVEMILYLDCTGNNGGFDNPAQIAVYNEDAALYTSFEATLTYTEKLPIDSQSCLFHGKCFERGVYRFPLNLPDDASNYIVEYQRCCRAGDITNLINPGDLGFTMSVEITAAARALKNNSPRWVNAPRLNTCAHELVNLDLSAVETDGDLLTYHLCSPLSGGGNLLITPDLFSCSGAVPTPPCPPPFDQLPFAIPDYNFNNPLGSSLAQLDPLTGIWTINPNHLGKFSYAVCVQEHRNGMLLSEVRQDIVLWAEDFAGFQMPKTDLNLECFPNPSSAEVFISTANFEGNTIQIELFDFSGKKWFSEKRENANSKERLDVKNLPNGIYWIRVGTDGVWAAGRFVRG